MFVIVKQLKKIIFFLEFCRIYQTYENISEYLFRYPEHQGTSAFLAFLSTTFISFHMIYKTTGYLYMKDALNSFYCKCCGE